MRLPRLRFTIGRLMVAVAVTALVSLVATNSSRHDGITDNRVVMPVASAVAAAYGLGAMRRPLMFLLPLIAAWIASPTVYDRTPDLIDASAGGCYLGWLIGAPAGWLSRTRVRLDDPVPIVPDTSEPK